MSEGRRSSLELSPAGRPFGLCPFLISALGLALGVCLDWERCTGRFSALGAEESRDSCYAWDSASEMFQTIYDFFWWDKLWLPGPLSWADITDHDGLVFPKASDLYASIPIAFVFLIIRLVFERFVATPIAHSLGVKEKIKLKASPNPMLEKFYISQKHPKQADVQHLAKQAGFSPRQVERWFRRRRNQDRPSTLKKFREACWRFTYYLVAFAAGTATLVDKPWFYDQREVWHGFPAQTLLPSQYWYYMIELGFYWSLVFRIASDVKRKDFKEQIIHHLATIVLISFSWCANYVRVGTLILALHDSADYLLESGKMLNYAGLKNLCNNVFIVFSVVFIITRLIIFPFWIIHCTWVYPVTAYQPFFGYYFFNAMLIVLQCLHIFWAYLILCVAYKFVTGQTLVDERSDHEETDISDEEGDSSHNGSINHKHIALTNNNHHKAD